MVGRYLKEPFADGYAVYEIVKENKKSVRVKVITGIGDDWYLPYWGVEATISKAYAHYSLESRDMLEQLFKRGE